MKQTKIIDVKMNKYENLVKKFPLIFQREEINPDIAQEPFILFGFECDIGWYHIIDNLCEELYSRYNSQQQTIRWVEKEIKDPSNYIAYKQKLNPDAREEDLVAGLNKELTEAKEKLKQLFQDIPIVAQVKEKFGGLRFYINFREGVSETAIEKINALIGFAESLSYNTCEKCGNIGKRYAIGWNRTLCEQHAVELYGKEAVNFYNNNTIEKL